MKIGCALLIAITALAAGPAEPDNGLAGYKEGNYKSAIPLLQAAAQNDPQDPVLAAALLSSLVYEGRADEAADAAEADADKYPNSPEVIAARGELAFYLGDMPEANRLFREALKLKDATPRAAFGLARLYRMQSMYRTARLLIMRAHEIDPDDALITSRWLDYLVPQKRKEMIGPFVAAHPWFYKHFEQQERTSTEIHEELGGRRAFEPAGERKETTLRLHYMHIDARRIRGFGLDVAIEGGKQLDLLFDTGASGILLKQAAIDKAGLNHLGSFEARGIGDQGARNAFAAVADNCSIGELQFNNCIFRALEGKARVAGDEDGLIGADFFRDYIIQIDFQKATLHLTPQADRPPNPQGFDRTVPPDEATFSPVFRAGGHLYVLTKVNGKSEGLFLLDTGSQLSMIDSSFARLSTKLYGNSFMRVRGISGEVKQVFEADKAELQFAHFQQSNLGLTSVNLNNSPDHEEFRLAGILGMPVLSMFRLTIDYRNGLVNFDYVFAKRH